MPFVTPNSQDSPTFQAQAVVDKTDLAALANAIRGYGVVSGCLVSPGGGYTVNVASGSIQIGSTQVAVAAATGLSLIAANATDRRDIVVSSNVGAVSIVSGTHTTETIVPWAATSLFDPPVKPAIPSNSVLLGEVYIPGGGGTIVASWLTDKTLVTSGAGPPVLIGTGDNGVTDNYASFNTQLTAFAVSGYGTVVLPATTGYYGVSQDLIVPVGVTIKGQGTYLNKFPAQNGNHGTVQWGSAIGPYVNAAPTFTNGVVVLSNAGSGIESLTVIGINNTNGTTYGRAANSAVYVTGTGAKATSTAVRIRDCVLWGGLISVLDCEIGADDLAVFDTQINNSEFQGTNAVGASPAGCVVLVRTAADIRFQGVQTFGGSVQFGYNSGASDMKWVGGHITADGITGTAACPSVYLSSGTGGGFSGVTFDNGSSNLQALIVRNKGTWAFDGCRFQTGSSYAYPLVKQNVDTANTSSTGDPYRGFMFSGCHVSGSGSFAGFTCLVNYTYITTAPATIPDVISGLVIDPPRLDASCGTTIGSPTVTDANIGTADKGKQVAGPGIPAHTYVGQTMTAGTSYSLSSSPTSQVNVNATATGTVTLGIGNVVGAAAGSLTTPNFYQLQGVDSATLVPVTTDCIVYNGVAVTRTP